ncbi:hypothetical protein SAMN04487910_1925 [Aquimarina amphilecti]|uniref:Uncharacterized protein n=1 Tax=Aquimarina amphilecti TaxID=1038014 RepID=A0A1H7N119_AQUAM|nr:hypothetical protein [Aquimarina amphilecti]SEL17124.1 hypothetical protein SAMN04487910_1925 [Aquimarina amphilecti]
MSKLLEDPFKLHEANQRLLRRMQSLEKHFEFKKNNIVDEQDSSYTLKFKLHNEKIDLDIEIDDFDRILVSKDIDIESKKINVDIDIWILDASLNGLHMNSHSRHYYVNAKVNYRFKKVYISNSMMDNIHFSNVVVSNLVLLNLNKRIRILTLECSLESYNIRLCKFEIFTLFNKLDNLNAENVDEAFIYKINISRSVNISENTLKKVDIRFLNISNARNTDINVIRRIKKSFEIEGNKYDYQRALVCEQKIIRRSLNRSSLLKNIPERFLLFLNAISNEFGINWIRATVFTFIVNIAGSIGVLLLLFDTSLYNINQKLIPLIFSNLSPLYNINWLQENNAGIIVYLLHLFTKILVLYGIYQTVQAFRNHSK